MNDTGRCLVPARSVATFLCQLRLFHIKYMGYVHLRAHGNLLVMT